MKPILIGATTLAISILGYANAYIDFSSPTPNDNTYTQNNNIYIELDMTGDIKDFSWNRNGASYKIYDSSLLLNYDFNSLASGFIDKSLYKKDGTGYNLSFSSTETSSEYFHTIFPGNLRFNGSNTSYIQAPADSIANTDELTIAIRLSTDNININQDIIKKVDENNNGIILNTKSGIFQASILNNILTGSFSNSVFHHIVITYKKGDMMKIFIDGSKTNEIYVDNNTIVANTGSLFIGSGLAGNIDELKIFNRTLSENEVTMIYGSKFVYGVGSSGIGSWRFNTRYTGLQDEIYTYTGTIIQNDNTTETRGRRLIIDNNNPTIYLSSPTSGTSISAQYFTLSRVGYDYPAGISGYTYTISTTGGVVVANGTTANNSVSISGLNNGTYLWNIRAYDKLNHNSLSETRTVIYQKPILGTAAFSGLVSSLYTNKTGVSLILTANKAVNYLITGNITTQIKGTIPNNTTKIEVPLTLLTGNGNKTVRVLFSNTGDATVEVQPSIFLDQTAPTVSLYNPIHLSSYNTGTLTFNWTTSDNTSVQEIRYYIDNLNTPKKIFSGTTSSYTETGLSNDSHAWKIEAIDIAGNITGSQVFIFSTDSSSPTIAGVENGKYYNTNRTPTIDGATQTWLNGVTYIPGTTITNEGSYTLLAQNIAGNKTQVSFIIDKTNPTINLSSPTNGTTLSTSNNIIFTRIGVDTNMSGYYLSINGTTTTGIYLPSTTTSYTVNNLANGSYSRSVRSFDKAENTITSASNTFTLNVTLTGSVQIQGTTGINGTSYSTGYITIQANMNKACTLAIGGDITSTITKSVSAGVTDTTSNINLSAGEGGKTVNVSCSNGTDTAYTTTFSTNVDLTAPSTPSFTNGTQNTGTFNLSWNAATDTGVGISDYVYSIYNGSTLVKYGTTTATSVTINNMEIGTSGTYIAYIQARDRLGYASSQGQQTFLYYAIADTIPDAISFDTEDDAEIERTYKSNSVTITGLSTNTSVLAYVDNGDLYIDGTNVGNTGYVKNGSVIKIALESSDEYETTTTAVIIIGNQSATFKITTMSEDEDSDNSDNNSSDDDEDDDIGDIIELSSTKKIQVSAIYNVLTDLYSSTNQDSFMSTLKSMVKERIQEMQDDNEDDDKIATLQYLYQLIDKDYDSDDSVTNYTAPNAKKYTITYTSGKGYTSSNFIKKDKYFSTMTEIKNYIDTNNKSGSSSTTTSYKVDQSRTSNPYTAPNKKVYRLFKTTDGKYSSYDLMSAKTFTTLAALKDYIYKNNKY